jgi:hypothetical protein
VRVLVCSLSHAHVDVMCAWSSRVLPILSIASGTRMSCKTSIQIYRPWPRVIGLLHFRCRHSSNCTSLVELR